MTTILIAEDHLVTQRVLSKRLRDAGHQVITVTNGCDAFDRLRETEVDIVITDLAMPKMDGLTLLKKIRADATYAHIPIIVLTASALDEQRLEASAAGADAFLEKPVSSWELESTLRRFMTGTTPPSHA